MPKSRNGKKVLTTFGKIELSKKQQLCPKSSKFGVSAHMQDIMSFTGQSMVYEEAAQLIWRLLGLDVNAMQIQRISLHYGQAMEPLISSNCES
ncbi:MAG: hypothetical protein ACJA01_000787, partial [Saprospiraceae bacterium]